MRSRLGGSTARSARPWMRAVRHRANSAGDLGSATSGWMGARARPPIITCAGRAAMRLLAGTGRRPSMSEQLGRKRGVRLSDLDRSRVYRIAHTGRRWEVVGEDPDPDTGGERLPA